MSKTLTPMTRRKWIILGALLVLLSIGAELVVRPWNSSKGCVQIVNQGDDPMDDLILSYGGTKVRVGGLGAGQSTNVWFTIGGKGTLNLEFKQKGNPMTGFQVPDFDPAENLADGLRLVLVVTEQSGRALHGRRSDTDAIPAEPDGYHQRIGSSPSSSAATMNAMEGVLDEYWSPAATMPECTRVFIAIAIPEPLERELARLQAELAPAVPACRWTSALPFHMTLAFLGDVPNSELSAICQVGGGERGRDRTI